MATVMWNPPETVYPWVAVLCGCFVGALWDARTGRIPNWLTGSLFLLGVIWSAVHHGWAGVSNGLLGSLMMAAPFILLFLVGGGAADAKLMGATGMWLGTRHGVVALLAVLICGVAMGVGYTIARKRGTNVLMNMGLILHGLFGLARQQHALADAPSVLPSPNSMTPMPYGVSIFVGVALAAVYVWTWQTGVLS